jgi:hypothetical protein
MQPTHPDSRLHAVVAAASAVGAASAATPTPQLAHESDAKATPTPSASESAANATPTPSADAAHDDGTINSSSHKAAYQRFLNRFQTKKAATSHPELVAKFAAKDSRAQLFIDFVKQGESLDAMEVQQRKRNFTQQLARKRLRPKTYDQILKANNNDREH